MIEVFGEQSFEKIQSEWSGAHPDVENMDKRYLTSEVRDVPNDSNIWKETSELDNPMQHENAEIWEETKNVGLSNHDAPEHVEDDFWSEQNNETNDELDIQEQKDKYVEDVINHSEVPDTIDADAAKKEDYVKLDPDETGEKRAEFNQQKEELKKQWEEANGQKWPKYEEDVYSENGKKIRNAGDDYDAHHVHPLSMGGENTASNITPMHASEHYDKQGVHSPNSPYAKLEEKLNNQSDSKNEVQK